MNTLPSNSRPLDDIDVREEECDDGAHPEGRIEFATFTEGEYVESIHIDRTRAAEVSRDLGTILGKVDPPRDSSNSDRETATVLAALRYWQREGLMSAGRERDVAEDGGRFTALSALEIDTLCEKINAAGYRD
jgi:hypothetical protein